MFPTSLALLALAGSADTIDPYDWRTGIHAAARDGNVIRVMVILRRHPEAANAPDPIGKGFYLSPVHIAAEYYRVEVLKVLIAFGGDVNARGKAGATPLQLAARWRSLAAADVLLARG